MLNAICIFCCKTILAPFFSHPPHLLVPRHLCGGLRRRLGLLSLRPRRAAHGGDAGAVPPGGTGADRGEGRGAPGGVGGGPKGRVGPWVGWGWGRFTTENGEILREDEGWSRRVVSVSVHAFV